MTLHKKGDSYRMFIRIEETPNPSTVKFLPGREIHNGASVDFKDSNAALACPLAAQLLQLRGVSSVLLGYDFVSVTKIDDMQWFALKPLILECLVNYFSVHQTVEIKLDAHNTDEDPILQGSVAAQIKELIETKVRPAVAMDGGDIIFHDFTDGIVYLKLVGACSGCPSSSVTLKNGIENMLKYYIPEVQEVRALDITL